MLQWPHSGFQVHTGVGVPAEDRACVLRLARYCARNPVALERMTYDLASEEVTYRSDKAEGPTAGTAPWTRDAAEAPVAIVEPVDWSLRAARFRWAELLRRIFEVDPLTCPRCQGLMRIAAVITEPAVITRILARRVRAPTPRLRSPPRRRRRKFLSLIPIPTGALQFVPLIPP
jgi:hypothetical protein